MIRKRQKASPKICLLFILNLYDERATFSRYTLSEKNNCMGTDGSKNVENLLTALRFQFT